MAHPEALLISALLSRGSVLALHDHHLHEGHFHEYRQEIEWLLAHRVKYREEPTLALFRTVFPDFRFTESPGSLEALADAVRDSHGTWATTKLIRQAAADLKDRAPFTDILERLHGESMEITKGIDTAEGTTWSKTDYAEKYDELLLDPDLGPTACFSHPTLQEWTNGMRGGDVTVMAARLGQGKTWTMVDTAVANVMAGKRVLYYSLEMSKTQMEFRFDACLSRRIGKGMRHSQIAHRKGFSALDYKALMQDFEREVPGDWMIIDTRYGAVTPMKVAAAVNKHCPDLVVIDYLTLLTPTTASTADSWQVIGSMTKELKTIAGQFNVPILTAAQINREGDTSGWKPPRSRHLSQSDQIGMDADRVITMKRYGQGAMVYLLDKNRHGADGLLYFSKYDPENGDFTEITKEQADDLRDDSDEVPSA